MFVEVVALRHQQHSNKYICNVYTYLFMHISLVNDPLDEPVSTTHTSLLLDDKGSTTIVEGRGLMAPYAAYLSGKLRKEVSSTPTYFL